MNKNPEELLTLKEWDTERCPKPHHNNTLLGWVRKGLISPPPVKMGREYRVKRKAKYYDINTGQSI